MTTFEFPCDIGDIVYAIMDDFPFPCAKEVRAIRIGEHFDGGYDIRFSARNKRTGEISTFSIDDFNKTVFANMEDAMKAIKNRT